MLRDVITSRFRWRYPSREPLDAAYLERIRAHGATGRLARVLAGRGVHLDEVDRFFAEPSDALLDPGLLPDAAIVVDRIAAAMARGDSILVFGDFDADGLTGLAILVRTLRRLGLDAEPFVPSRIEDGHGLSLRAVEAARAAGRSLIVTVDTGSSSVDEVQAAAAAGLDVIITDHHRVPPERPRALALVNPHRPDGVYPDRRLAGSGVALKVAALLLHRLSGIPVVETVREYADLAAIGTVADVAPIVGENRAIAQLGLERIRSGSRPGIGALLERAGVAPPDVTLETISFVIAPRLNSAGRMGEAADAAHLLLVDDPAAAADLAGRLESANSERRDVTRLAVDEARAAVLATAGEVPAGEPAAGAVTPESPVVAVRGTWPVGVIGLVAARLAEEHGRPAIVATAVGVTLRASCRAPAGYDLAAALEGCADLLVRHGGHRGAAGFEMDPDRWDELVGRLPALLGDGATGGRELILDLAIPARSVDYALQRDLAMLAPTGPGFPEPIIGVHGLTVTRVRAAAGGHTQLTLRREVDVLDAIAFGRGDLVDMLQEGDRVDVAATIASRRFGGFESLQLLVLDVSPARDASTSAGAARATTDALTPAAADAPLAAARAATVLA